MSFTNVNLPHVLGATLIGVLAGIGDTLWLTRQRAGRSGVDVVAVDFRHVLDLLRRVHGAVTACLIMEDETPAVSLGEPRPLPEVVERVVATARLAMGDGRYHLLQGDP